MPDLNVLFQTADWKKEKHTPVIKVKKKDGFYKINVKVGEEIAHPNTTAHFIAWIQLIFHPEGAKFPFEIGKADFSAHGSSTDGPDTSKVYTEPSGHFALKTEKPGTLIAFSYCNIHGLWRNEEKLEL